MLFATFALALCYFLQIKVLCRSNANEIRALVFYSCDLSWKVLAKVQAPLSEILRLLYI